MMTENQDNKCICTIYILRLHTGPKDNYYSQILSTPIYKKVMENVKLSFNDLSISRENTLREPKSAFFYGFEKARQSKDQVIYIKTFIFIVI